jgi:hypothetical protein
MENKKSVVFVASALPIQLLSLYQKEWDVQTIVISDKLHLPSYNYLLKKNQQLKFKILSGNIILSITTLLIILLKIKISGKRVIFFHEAAWPWFDLFITFIKPAGLFLPQLSNLGRTQVNYESVASHSTFARMLKWFNLDRLFDIFLVFTNGGASINHFFSIKKYPESVISFNENYSRQLIIDKSKEFEGNCKRKILILSGKDWIADEIQIKAFLKIIEIALKYNFQCFIKDHPSIQGRLNLSHIKVQSIDPAIPVELIENDFAFAIGFATVGLLFFKDSAISIVDAVENIDENIRRLRKQHLTSLVGGEKVKFIKALDEFNELFEEYSIT